MNPEQRGIVAVRVQLAVKIAVIFIRQISGLLAPGRIRIVDDVVDLNGTFGFFLTLPFFDGFVFAAKLDGHWQKLAVFFQQTFDALFFEELFAVFTYVQDNICSPGLFFNVFESIFWVALTNPAHGSAAFLPGLGLNFHRCSHHKGGVETQTKITDDVGFVFVFFQKLLGT